MNFQNFSLTEKGKDSPKRADRGPCSAICHRPNVSEAQQPLVSGDESQIKHLRRRRKEAICGITVKMQSVRCERDLVSQRSFAMNSRKGQRKPIDWICR
jgi:hypothetical protein